MKSDGIQRNPMKIYEIHKKSKETYGIHGKPIEIKQNPFENII